MQCTQKYEDLASAFKEPERQSMERQLNTPKQLADIRHCSIKL